MQPGSFFFGWVRLPWILSRRPCPTTLDWNELSGWCPWGWPMPHDHRHRNQMRMTSIPSPWSHSEFGRSGGFLRRPRISVLVYLLSRSFFLALIFFFRFPGGDFGYTGACSWIRSNESLAFVQLGLFWCSWISLLPCWLACMYVSVYLISCQGRVKLWFNFLVRSKFWSRGHCCMLYPLLFSYWNFKTSFTSYLPRALGHFPTAIMALNRR